MTEPARPFGLMTGGVDRRVLTDRRAGERRVSTRPVHKERRGGPDRRSRRGRRITEWFAPVGLSVTDPPRSPNHVTPYADTRAEDKAVPMRTLLAQTAAPRTEPPFLTHTFCYKGRSYEIESEDVKDQREKTTGRQWLVKVGGVVEHTLRVLPTDDAQSLERRTIEAIDHAGARAVQELDFVFQGKRHRLEDWSNKLSPHVAEKLNMWCVTCDGVIEGTLAVPKNESVSELHQRAIAVTRQSGSVKAFESPPLPPQRQPQRLSVEERDYQPSSRPFMMVVWVLLGMVVASAVSSLIQSSLFGAP